MESISLSEALREALKMIEGKTTEEKIEYSIEEVLKHKLHQCNDDILSFEAKYGLSFEEFAAAWERGDIPHRHSYEVESDYIDWEALEMEKKNLLKTLAQIGTRDTHERRRVSGRSSETKR